MESNIEREISLRLEKYMKTVSRTFALVRDNRISTPEIRRRNRAADQEMRTIRKLISEYKRRKGKKSPKRIAAKSNTPEFKNPYDKIRRTYTKPPGSRSKWP